MVTNESLKQFLSLQPEDPRWLATGIKTAWASAHWAAGARCRFQDLRHTACAKPVEAGVSDATLNAIIGLI